MFVNQVLKPVFENFAIDFAFDYYRFADLRSLLNLKKHRFYLFALWEQIFQDDF